MPHSTSCTIGVFLAGKPRQNVLPQKPTRRLFGRQHVTLLRRLNPNLRWRAEHHPPCAAPPEGDVEPAIRDRHGLIQAPRRSAGSPTLAILNANNRIDFMARKPRWHGITSATGLRPRVSPAGAALRAPTRAATSRAMLAQR